MQDEKNITYFSSCEQNHEEVDIFCKLTSKKDLLGQIHNWATTFFMSRYSLQFHHVYAYTTTKHYNRVFLDEIRAGSDEI